MTNNKPVRSFRYINVLFSALLIILVLIYAGAVASLYGIDPVLLELTVLFAAIVIGTGAAWNLSLRRQITSFMESVDGLVDGAIHGRTKHTLYEETLLSSLEHKLGRYIEISQANELHLETEKNKIKSLISDISHQTKTPLSNIRLYSQLLAELPGLDKETQLLVDQIEAQSDKLEWLITSLIKLSRLETGMITLQNTPAQVLPTITRALAPIYTAADSKQIDITIDCGELIQASHDPQWTGEALFNLVENSVKYTKAGGSINIEAESNEMFTRITVSDNGTGIQREELEHIFKRFYRGKSAREFEGVGIGLYLAKEIINLQGGFMTAASEPGEGTMISIFLPQL